jgi:hypothetical protein
MTIPFQLDQVMCDIPEAGLDIPVQMLVLADEQEVSARLSRIDRGVLKLSSPAALPTDTRIELAIDGCTVRAEVVSCEQEARGIFMLAVRRVYGPLGATRSEPRIPVDLSATLTRPGSDRMFARLVDMSQSGLGFELPAAVPVGARVSVHFLCGIAFGEIRHCSKALAVYRAGMRIDEFVVRRHPATVEMGAIIQTRRAHSGRMRFHLSKPFLMVARRAVCSLAGHEYGWFTDVWERAILRCSRCTKVLSA